jgi:7-cyano-7-deazaguanine synthase in queuosine biosynthesis
MDGFPIETLTVFKRLDVGNIIVGKKRITATYTLTHYNGRQVSNRLIYSYERDLFDTNDPVGRNVASVILAQLALNYGLFCETIHFDGVYDEADRKFIRQMTENTSREIYIKKILSPNPFLTGNALHINFEKKERYTNAAITFATDSFPPVRSRHGSREPDKNRHVILSSGGKDSLLTYGLLNELGKEVMPVFINESGRHWFTALNAYRYIKDNDARTARVWCNSDRLFAWMNTQMPFIRRDFRAVRADDYPLRLWTVALFLFGALPLAMSFNAGRIVIGDEYDATQKMSFRGVDHYNGYFDQSRYFDRTLSRYFRAKGWNISQFSLIRTLSELLIMKVLVKRYPRLQEQQVSCHAAHVEGHRSYPCGRCEKCRRIVGMLSALGEDPRRCGYTSQQIEGSLRSLAAAGVHQIESDAAELYYLLAQKGLVEKNIMTARLARAHEETLKLRFDGIRSAFDDMPVDLRKPLFSIFLQYADGAVRKTAGGWEEFDLPGSKEILTPFPFEK